METEAGDDYIRKLAASIRTHEQQLADVGFVRRPGRQPAGASTFPNVLGWIGLDFSTPTPNAPGSSKPVVLSTDLHRLFYLLIRFDGLGIGVGPLDVHLESPRRPASYISMLSAKDKSDVISLSSFRSGLSAVSKLSLGAAWWGRPEPPNVDSELKYIYSAFTKIPALSVHATGLKHIHEQAHDPPSDSAVPFDAFKNLQTLELVDVDPRAILGWDRLADSLRSLTIKRSGLEDVSDIFVDAVLDDQARREGTNKGNVGRKRTMHYGFYARSREPSFSSAIAEEEEETRPPIPSPPGTSPSTPPVNLPPSRWRFIKHLSLSDNALTFIPSAPLPFLISLTHLDLSSNLLVSVPIGLSQLYNLVSLNLSDNMIESVLGIYTQLGGILTLNLSRNRLDSLCGLERLAALERVDLRENRIEDPGEVGRLAVLPNVAEVSIEGNPFVRTDPNHRVRCFDYFAKEGKIISLDGAAPTFIEKRNMVAVAGDRLKDAPVTHTVPSPPVVAVGSPPNKNQGSNVPVQVQSPIADPASPVAGPTTVASAQLLKPRKRKNKRIVDLDGDDGSDATEPRHSRGATDATIAGPSIQAAGDPPPVKTSSPLQTAMTLPPEDSQPSALPRNPQARHSRYATEMPPLPSPTQTPAQQIARRKISASKTLMAPRNSTRAKLSPSMFEPDMPPLPTPSSPTKGAEAFRARIEALRDEVGDSWLKVLSQSGGFTPDSSSSSPPAESAGKRRVVGLAADV